MVSSRPAERVEGTGHRLEASPGRRERSLLENFTACTTCETRLRVRVSAYAASVHSPAGQGPRYRVGDAGRSCAWPRTPSRMGSCNRATDSVRAHTPRDQHGESGRTSLHRCSETRHNERLDTWYRHRLGCCPVAQSGACLRTSQRVSHHRAKSDRSRPQVSLMTDTATLQTR